MAASTTTIAYAVHVDGGMWDDRRISVWCPDPQDALMRLERAAEFFAGDDVLLTIVRAEFTPREWEVLTEAEWTRPAITVGDDVFLMDDEGEPGPLVTVMETLAMRAVVDVGDSAGMVVGLGVLEPIVDCAECGEPAPLSVRVCPLHPA